MKQHITTSQLNELSDEGKKRLNTWMESKDYNYWIVADMPGLNIGQMIEFLDEKEYGRSIVRDKFEFLTDDEDICDALWEACKEILEK